MDSQTYKFFKEQYQTKPCGDWFVTVQKREGKLNMSHINPEQPFEHELNVFIPFKEKPKFKFSKKWSKLMYSQE